MVENHVSTGSPVSASPWHKDSQMPVRSLCKGETLVSTAVLTDSLCFRKIQMCNEISPLFPGENMNKLSDALLLWGIQKGAECHTQGLGGSCQAEVHE